VSSRPTGGYLTTHVLTIDLRDIVQIAPPAHEDYLDGLYYAVQNTTSACWTMWVDDIIARTDLTQRDRVDYLSSLIQPWLRRRFAGRVLSFNYLRAGELEYGEAGKSKKLEVLIQIKGAESLERSRIALPCRNQPLLFPEASYHIIGAPKSDSGLRILETIIADLYPL
jgi:hypothetical protein